jgi:hypothetical protein
MNINFSSYFKDEKEVFIQNVAEAQVTVAFDGTNGHAENYLFPNSRDPINLSDYIPFNIIKGSLDLRKMLGRKPQALTILSEEEYKAYYTKKAISNELFTKDTKGKKVPDINAAIKLADEKRQGVQAKLPLADAKAPKPIRHVDEDGEEENDDIDHKQAFMDDIVNPKILHLCNQVNTGLADKEKMSASELLSELADIESRLKITDYEYVINHGYYKSVKNYAKKKMGELSKE